MNNQSAPKKLSLNRETIRILDDASLTGVNGGTGPWGILFRASVKACNLVVQATKWAADHAPEGDPDNPPSVVTATA